MGKSVIEKIEDLNARLTPEGQSALKKLVGLTIDNGHYTPASNAVVDHAKTRLDQLEQLAKAVDTTTLPAMVVQKDGKTKPGFITVPQDNNAITPNEVNNFNAVAGKKIGEKFDPVMHQPATQAQFASHELARSLNALGLDIVKSKRANGDPDPIANLGEVQAGIASLATQATARHENSGTPVQTTPAGKAPRAQVVK